MPQNPDQDAHRGEEAEAQQHQGEVTAGSSGRLGHERLLRVDGLSTEEQAMGQIVMPLFLR